MSGSKTCVYSWYTAVLMVANCTSLPQFKPNILTRNFFTPVFPALVTFQPKSRQTIYPPPKLSQKVKPEQLVPATLWLAQICDILSVQCSATESCHFLLYLKSKVLDRQPLEHLPLWMSPFPAACCRQYLFSIDPNLYKWPDQQVQKKNILEGFQNTRTFIS